MRHLATPAHDQAAIALYMSRKFFYGSEGLAQFPRGCEVRTPLMNLEHPYDD